MKRSPEPSLNGTRRDGPERQTRPSARNLSVAVVSALLWTFVTSTPREAQAVTYYLRGDTTTNLGFDGTANLPTAQSTGTTIPYRGSLLTTGTAGISWRPTSIPAGTNNMIDGYTAVYAANAVDISAISSSCSVRNGSNTDIWRFTLYDYNPTTGARTLMATSADVTGITAGNTVAAVPASWSISNARVQQNNRIVFRIQKISTVLSNGDRVYYEPTTAPNCQVTFTETPVAGTTTTLGDGVAGTSATVCPGATAQKIDGFSFINSAGTNPVTALTATSTNQAAIASLQVWNEAGGTQYFATVNNPGSNTWNFSGGTSVPVGTSAANFKILATFQGHATAPAGTTTTTANVTAFTTVNNKAGTDTAETTLTLDNQAALAATWGTNTAGNAQITLNWTYGTAGDSVAIVRYTANTDTTMPVDGTTYVVGNAFGTGGTVRFVGSTASPQNWVDNVGVVNATTYYYRVFETDACLNYAATAPWSAGLTPTAPVPAVTPGSASASVNSCSQIAVSAPFTGDSNANSTTTFGRGASAGGPFSTVCAAVSGASPRSCTDNTVAGSTTYYYQVDFADADGVTGTDPQVTGPHTTPSCSVNPTTAGTATAVVGSCSQITVSAPFTGDDDGDGTTYIEFNTANTWPGTPACTVSSSSPRTCLVTGLNAATAYYLRATYSDPDGVSGTSPQVLPGTYTTPACAGNNSPPMLLFVAPARDAILGGTDRFKVQIYDPDGVATANVLFAVDGGALSNTGVSKSASYTCNLEAQTNCGVYEFDVNTTVLANGKHTVTVKATDSATTPSVAQRSWPFQVNNAAAGKPAGAGVLLRRTQGSQLCIDCHNLATHSSQSTSFGYGAWSLECLACHTPHATNNIYLIRPTIATPNSGNKSVDFRNTTGVAANSFATPQASGNGVNVCEVCHTKTQNSDATARARNNAPTDWTKHYSGDCRACHTHASGFAGGGESGGNDDCLGCHQFGMAVAESNRATTYHHVLEQGNLRTGGITTYPTNATPTVAADGDKTCTQCHADHNIFRPDKNLSNTLGRGANLRSRIANAPPAGNPPAAAAPGDAAPGYYTNRDHDGTFTSGGICLSCHLSVQTKNTVDQKSDGTTQTPAVVSSAANFTASAHSFGVNGAIAKDATAFTVACAKCHSTSNVTKYQNGTYKFETHASDNRRLLNPLGITTPVDPLEENFCFRCHSRTTDATPGGGPVKGTANRDYYNQVPMSGQSELVFNQFATNATYDWDHPVQGSGGRHDPIEGSTANDGTLSGTQRHVQCEDCHNPHSAAPIASGIYAGSVTAFTTNADPNPDLLTDSTKTWTVNALKGFTVKMTSGAQAGKYSAIYSNTATALSVNFATAPAAADKYVIVNWGVTSANATWAGNRVSPAMSDTWGLNPTWVAQPTPLTWDDSAGTATAAEITTQYNAITVWGRTNSATVQGQICIKCHSAFAYGATPPNTPSGAGNSTTGAWVDTAGPATLQSDIANQFNPNNLAHHAVFARGKNQPLVSSDATTSTYNPNWPKYTTGTLAATNGSTAVTLTGGTWPATILPGWFLYIGSAAPAQAIAGWYEITAVGSTTTLTLDRAYTGTTGSGKAYMLTAGLGNLFVPPWGPWSTLSCSDCHTSAVQSDPFGPHGSSIKWLLRGGEPQNFLFYNGTAVATVTYTPNVNNLCLNCHRRDAYGDLNLYPSITVAPATYPRQGHPPDSGDKTSLSDNNKWGIPCMNCHGGARIGQIHGSNLGLGRLAGAAAGASYSGRRLLAGSTWYSVTRSSTTVAGKCWTKNSTDSVDNCAHRHQGDTFESGFARYDYESATP